jgi:hypothetical protein
MSQEVVINEKDLITLKSHGTVYICRSCKDNKDRLVLINYKSGGIHQVFTGFCVSCAEEIESCSVCPKY